MSFASNPINCTLDLPQISINAKRAKFLVKACRTTRLDPPVDLLYTEELQTFGEARRREAQVKRWSRAKKEALVPGYVAKAGIIAQVSKQLSHDAIALLEIV